MADRNHVHGIPSGGFRSATPVLTGGVSNATPPSAWFRPWRCRQPSDSLHPPGLPAPPSHQPSHECLLRTGTTGSSRGIRRPQPHPRHRSSPATSSSAIPSCAREDPDSTSPGSTRASRPHPSHAAMSRHDSSARACSPRQPATPSAAATVRCPPGAATPHPCAHAGEIFKVERQQPLRQRIEHREPARLVHRRGHLRKPAVRRHPHRARHPRPAPPRSRSSRRCPGTAASARQGELHA